MQIHLIHWRATEAAAYVDQLAAADHLVTCFHEFKPGLLKAWRAAPPDAFVIDLSRSPSHGREVAVSLRNDKTLRHLPIVFCEGDPAKVALLHSLLSDAAFCQLPQLTKELARAKPNSAPIIPAAMMDRYQGRSVAQKLGIQANSSVRLIDAPPGLPAALAPLPDGVLFSEDPAPVTLCFASDPAGLKRGISRWRNWAPHTKLWICWKKGAAAARATGVSESLVRETGIALGLVDYKICAVSPIWSGLLFAPARNK